MASSDVGGSSIDLRLRDGDLMTVLTRIVQKVGLVPLRGLGPQAGSEAVHSLLGDVCPKRDVV